MEFKDPKTLTESSIEEWASRLDKQPKRLALTDNNLFKTYMSVVMHEDDMENDKEANELVMNSQTMACVFFKRVLFRHSYGVSVGVAFVMGELCKNFGSSTIYANYLQYKCKQTNTSWVGIKTLSTWFPMGFFTEDVLEQAWNDQKINDKPDNMLDHREYMKSIELERQ